METETENVHKKIHKVCTLYCHFCYRSMTCHFNKHSLGYIKVLNICYKGFQESYKPIYPTWKTNNCVWTAMKSVSGVTT